MLWPNEGCCAHLAAGWAGYEALAQKRELVEGKAVSVEEDVSETDQYGRREPGRLPAEQLTPIDSCLGFWGGKEDDQPDRVDQSHFNTGFDCDFDNGGLPDHSSAKAAER